MEIIGKVRITWGSCGWTVLVVGVYWSQPAVCQSKTTVSCSSPHPHQGHNGWSARCHRIPLTEASEALALCWCNNTVQKVKHMAEVRAKQMKRSLQYRAKIKLRHFEQQL